VKNKDKLRQQKLAIPEKKLNIEKATNEQNPALPQDPAILFVTSYKIEIKFCDFTQT